MKKKTNKKSIAKPAAKKVQIYKLEKGVKIPEVAQSFGSGQPGKVSLTLHAMEVGHSFAIPSELEALKAIKIVMDFNGREKKRANGKKFATRRVKKGIRVWRTA
jgi:hypothetical protein